MRHTISTLVVIFSALCCVNHILSIAIVPNHHWLYKRQAVVGDSCAANCGKSSRNANNLSGGQLFPDTSSGQRQVQSGQDCWQIALVETIPRSPYKHLCTGALISDRDVLLPAQCVSKFRTESPDYLANNVKLVAGVSNLRNVGTEQNRVERGMALITIHPEFVADRSNLTDWKRYHAGNIAIIRLNRPIDCADSPNVCAICLPAAADAGQSAPPTNSQCSVSSWNERGALLPSSPNLNSVLLSERPVNVLSNHDCEAQVKANTVLNDFTLTSAQFCARDQTVAKSCQGDLGDPLVCVSEASALSAIGNSNRKFLYGLNLLGTNCFASSLPTQYVNVQKFVPWIEANSKAVGQSVVSANSESFFSSSSAALFADANSAPGGPFRQFQSISRNGVLQQTQITDMGTSVQTIRQTPLSTCAGGVCSISIPSI